MSFITESTMKLTKRTSFNSIKEACKKHVTVEEVLEALELSEEDIDEATLEYIKNEVSMTGAAAPTATPHAFKDDEMEKNKKIKERRENIENKFAEEIMLHEASYRDFSGRTPKSRIGSSIKELNRRLSEMEKIIGHATRLKQESGTVSAKYNTSTRNHIMRIKERMVNVIRGLKELES